MSVYVTMKDTVAGEKCDVEYDQVIQALNESGMQGKIFVGLPNMHGHKVAFNIPNIMMITEIDDEE